MSSFYASGAGNPEFDAGAGDPLGYTDFPGEVPLALGAGDPLLLDDAPLYWFPHIHIWAPGSAQFSDLRYFNTNDDIHQITWEGGHLLSILSFGFQFTDGPYRIDFYDGAAYHPLLEPGCYSAVEGGGSEIYPEPDGSTLVFASPPLLIGEYQVRITDRLNQSVLMPNLIQVYMDLDCIETESLQASLDPKVYPGAFPDKEYP